LLKRTNLFPLQIVFLFQSYPIQFLVLELALGRVEEVLNNQNAIAQIHALKTAANIASEKGCATTRATPTTAPTTKKTSGSSSAAHRGEDSVTQSGSQNITVRNTRKKIFLKLKKFIFKSDVNIFFYLTQA
jgi:hypothetical protein